MGNIFPISLLSLIVLSLLFTLALDAHAQVPDTTYVELLVQVTDTFPSKQDRSTWTAEMFAEERAGNAKQGYIIRAESEEHLWGRLEKDPKRFIIVKVPEEKFDLAWLEPVYDESGEVAQLRKYRLPLESVLTEQELSDLRAIPYNEEELRPAIIKTEDSPQLKIKEVDFGNLPEPIKLHGSSGTKTICLSGCDYTSLGTWESTEEADLTGTGPAIANITGAFGDNAFTITGWTTTASDYIEIHTSGAARNPTGVWSDSYYRIAAGTGEAIDNREDNLRVDGLQLTQSSDDTLQSQGTGEHYISNNIIGLDSTAGFHRGIDVEVASVAYVWNNIVFNRPNGTAGGTGLGITIQTGAEAYNNTIIGPISEGIRVVNGVATTTNNVAFGTFGTAAFREVSGGTFVGDNNAYSSGADPASNGVDLSSYSAAQVFDDPDNNDFSLISDSVNSSPLVDAGVSDPGSGLFADDNAGVTRYSPWDIGALEFVPPRRLRLFEGFTLKVFDGRIIIYQS